MRGKSSLETMGKRGRSRSAGLSEGAVKVLRKETWGEPGNPSNISHSKSCREDGDFSKTSIFG